MSIQSIASLFLSASLVLGACGSDATPATAPDEALAEQGGHVLRSRHVLAALHIAEDFSLQQNGTGLDDFARSNVELGVIGEFQRDPARTVGDLEAVWEGLDAERRSELVASRTASIGSESASLEAEREEPVVPDATDSNLQRQWLDLVDGKVLVYTNSTSIGYGDLGIANVLVERFTLHSDKRFEMTSGSMAAGAGIDQVAIDDHMAGTWSLEALHANEAIVHVTVSGRTAPMPLTLQAGQLYLMGKPVAVTTP